MTTVALTGIGYWGPNLARVLHQSPKCDFVAACDCNETNLQKVAQQYPSVALYKDFGALLETDVGSKRMVVYDDMDTAEKIKVYDRGVEFVQPQTFGEYQLSYRLGDMNAPHIGNAEPLLKEIEHFVHCVQTGEQAVTSGEFGARVVEALELVDSNNLGIPIVMHALAARGR